MEDLPAGDGNDAAGDASTTTVAFGQAEPGRNIFQGVPHEELKSKSVVAEKAEEDENIPAVEKEISSVNTQTQTLAAVVQPQIVDVQAEEVVQPHGEHHIAATGDADVVAPAIQAETTDAATLEAVTEQTQGAPEEMEAEADRARVELFPDALDAED